MNIIKVIILAFIALVPYVLKASPITSISPVQVLDTTTNAIKTFDNEFHDDDDSTGHNNKDGFMSISGVVSSLSMSGGNIDGFTLDWNIHNDTAFTLIDVYLVFEFSDAVELMQSSNQWETIEYNALTEFTANNFVIPTVQVGSLSSHGEQSGTISFIAKTALDSSLGLGLFMTNAFNGQFDVLFNRSESSGVSDWSQSIGQDFQTGPVLAENVGDSYSDVSVFFGDQVPVPVPVPNTLLLFMIGLIGLIYRNSLKQKNALL